MESDLSAFHRIDDPMQLTAARFFALIYRLPAYRGVMRLMVENDIAKKEQRNAPAAGRGYQVPAGRQEVSEEAMLATLGPQWGERHTE